MQRRPLPFNPETKDKMFEQTLASMDSIKSGGEAPSYLMLNRSKGGSRQSWLMPLHSRFPLHESVLIHSLRTKNAIIIIYEDIEKNIHDMNQQIHLHANSRDFHFRALHAVRCLFWAFPFC